MPKVFMVDSRYTYCHENKKGFREGIDVHEIIISKSKKRSVFSFFCALLFVLHVSHLLLVKEKLGVFISETPLLSFFIAKVWQLNAVEKESIIIMPAFGVQFETHCRSGRVVRRFVSIGKILKPVLNEVVTPVTCYWSLALILRGEEKLMLAFQIEVLHRNHSPQLKCWFLSGGHYVVRQVLKLTLKYLRMLDDNRIFLSAKDKNCKSAFSSKI